jgi:alpha-L-arabinofuranosidase
MMRRAGIALIVGLALGLTSEADLRGQEARIVVRPDRPGPEISRTMTGACIEDVNHEIYGGIDSQMIFGESFAEPPATSVEGFKAYGGDWRVEDGVLRAGAGEGPKLVADRPPLGSGEVAVKVRFEGERPGLAGLILKVREAGVGADRFTGYEVSLDPSRQVLGIGRHRGNWEPILDAPCAVPSGRWIELAVTLTESGFAVRVDGKAVAEYEDREHPLSAGGVGLRTWLRPAEFRDLTIDGASVPFLAVDPAGAGGVSGMWRMVRDGSAEGRLAWSDERPFSGGHDQVIEFRGGRGALGVENRGLNRRGLGFLEGKPYEGYLWVRAEAPTVVHVSAQDGEGTRTYAEAALKVEGDDWKRYDFTLTPDGSDPAGRFSVTLTEPGSVALGYAFLQPGSWGRFHDLPVRRDVAEGLIRGGITVMRLGGLMANAEGYRWKNMIGPRDRRPPYKGFWYDYSSNGWGIFDFLDFCNAAGFAAVVDVNLDETPADLADLVRYANGPADSGWGRKRAEGGHPEPYGLKYLEIGNEEAVDEHYWERFRPIAEALWAADPGVVLIVGDFEYREPIRDPMQFEGAPRIKTLAAHKKILELAKEHDREVWFDVHIWNQNPRECRPRVAALASFDEALKTLAPGARYALCVLEENSVNHAVRRAVAHGETVNGLMRMGDRVRIVCAANALQPDGQNDNGWDQGLLFLDPTHVWAQPPLSVTEMITRNFRPQVLSADVSSPGDVLDATALADDGGVTLQVANVGDARVRTSIELPGAMGDVVVTRLSGPLDDANTAEDPERVVPWSRTVRAEAGRVELTFDAHSFTVLRFPKASR